MDDRGPAGPSWRTWRALIAANLLGASSMFNLTSVGAVADTVGAHYTVPLEAVGLLTGVLFVGQLPLLLVGGRLIDRFGPRRLGLACLAVIAITNPGMLLVSWFTGALAVRLATGVAVGVGFVAGTAYVRAVGGSAAAQGVSGGVTMAGAGLAIATVPVVESVVGWSAPFVTAAAVAGIGMLALMAGPAASAPPATRPTARMLFRDTRLARLGLIQAATFGLSIILGNWIVALLLRHGDYTLTTAGAIGSLTLIGGIVGRPLGGLLATQHPDRSRQLVAGSMLVGGTATLGLSVATPALLAVVCSLLVGVAAGLPFGPVYHAATALRAEAPAAAVAVLNLPALVLLTVGTPLFGLAFTDPTAGRSGFVLVALLWAATAAVVPSNRLLQGETVPKAA